MNWLVGKDLEGEDSRLFRVLAEWRFSWRDRVKLRTMLIRITSALD